MSRPHIEFVQAQHLDWQDNFLPFRPGVAVKLLSQDAATGAFSALLRYPVGWSQPPEILAVDEEFFVLDGDLAQGDLTYGPDCFAFWPRGFARRATTSSAGAVVLSFFSGAMAPGTAAMFDPARLVLRTNLREGEWKADLDAMGLGVMASSARIRQMRADPNTGEMTYITACIPYWRESQAERHPVIQEIFCLAGEVAGPQGIMRAGGYIWRPENKTHGPYGSTTGAVFFFRSHGGPQRTEHDPPSVFSFERPHAPVLPPELQSRGAAVAPLSRY